MTENNSVEERPLGGQGPFKSMTADLSFLTLYGLGVALLGWPRSVTTIATSKSGNLELVKDTHTGRCFMTKSDPRGGLVQYTADDAHYFK